MSDQVDSFANEYIPDLEVLRMDELDLTSVVDDIQADGVGHTKADIENAYVRATMDLIEEGYYPQWAKNGLRAYIRRKLNSAYARQDTEGLLLYPSVNVRHERKLDAFTTEKEAQYVIEGLLDAGDQLHHKAKIRIDRCMTRFSVPRNDSTLVEWLRRLRTII